MTDNIAKMVGIYRRMMNRRLLTSNYNGCYAFIGVGSHAIYNLYPVVRHLNIHLKYICCKSPDKLPLIRRRFDNVCATASVSDIVNDEEVSGVLVSASPSAHFAIASEVLSHGKSLFIEKPPCRTESELARLVAAAEAGNVKVAMAGMQKRYSPVTSLLRKNIGRESGVTYNIRYLTGLYPDGDVLNELFIHPLDYVCHLFGEAEISGFSATGCSGGGITLMLILRHERASGVAELSTAYTWTDATESLTVNTRRGCFTMNRMEELTFMPRRSPLFGVPPEKVFKSDRQLTTLYGRNNFNPTLPDNQLYSQGFYNEIKAFADAVESGRQQKPYQLATMSNTFRLIEAIRKRL